MLNRDRTVDYSTSPQSPHRAVRAEFPHTVPHVIVSLSVISAIWLNFISILLTQSLIS